MDPTGFQLIAELTDCAPAVLADDAGLAAVLEQSIAAAGLTAVLVKSHRFEPAGSTVVAILSESHAVLHAYPEAGHVSADIFTCSGGRAAPARLLEELRTRLGASHVHFAEVSRGRALGVTRPGTLRLSSTDGLEISLQVKEFAYSAASAHQLIQVADTAQFGRLLVLDGHVQLCSRDQDLYVDALLEPFAAKTVPRRVLVLGGADGTVAARLLQRGAEFVQAVDIDPEVGRVVAEYFPELRRDKPSDAASGGTLEFASAEVLSFLESSGSFDAIVCDLTMHPEAFVRIPRERYLEALFCGAARVLPPGGIFALQVSSAFDHVSNELVRRLCRKHFSSFESHKRFIPSLCREWVFASAVKAD